jgi:hypothetical protein
LQVALTPKSIVPFRIRRRVAAAGIVLALASALTVATLLRSDLATAVGEAGNAVGEATKTSLNNIKTVAAMLADRSPGNRPEGALASLKQKRQPALHERALPKVRKPESPLAGIVGTPPVPPVEVPPETPLYSMVAGPPVAVPATTLIRGGPGGPPPGSEIAPPGGGGGLIVPPTNTSTPSTPVIPVTPSTPAVPEPDTWAMMLIGFALMGWTIRRDRRAGIQRATG